MTDTLSCNSKTLFSSSANGLAGMALLLACLWCPSAFGAEDPSSPQVTEEQGNPMPVPEKVEKSDIEPPAGNPVKEQNGSSGSMPIKQEGQATTGETAPQATKPAGTPLVRKQNTSPMPLTMEQPIAIVPFKFPVDLHSSVRSLDSKELSQRFHQELQDAFASYGFTILQPEVSDSKSKDTIVFAKPNADGTESVAAEQQVNQDQGNQSNTGRALLLGEVFSIRLHPVNYMQIAGNERMNAKVEVSGRALVEQETSTEILFTSKSFAGISNASAKANDDLGAQERLYMQAVHQALADCARNLVRTLSNPTPLNNTPSK